jgi:hypothetical protein
MGVCLETACPHLFLQGAASGSPGEVSQIAPAAAAGPKYATEINISKAICSWGQRPSGGDGRRYSEWGVLVALWVANASVSIFFCAECS